MPCLRPPETLPASRTRDQHPGFRGSLTRLRKAVDTYKQTGKTTQEHTQQRARWQFPQTGPEPGPQSAHPCLRFHSRGAPTPAPRENGKQRADEQSSEWRQGGRERRVAPAGPRAAPAETAPAPPHPLGTGRTAPPCSETVWRRRARVEAGFTLERKDGKGELDSESPAGGS